MNAVAVAAVIDEGGLPAPATDASELLVPLLPGRMAAPAEAAA